MRATHTTDGRLAPTYALIEPAALEATRAAAIACQAWFGRGDGMAADAAATDAMRAALAEAPGLGTVIIGEGAKDEAAMLYDGERVGTGEGPVFDIAVDPLEGTSLLAQGLAGALSTIAIVEAECLWSPGPSYYADKLVVGPQARDAVDIGDPPERTLARVAEALGKRIGELRVVVLDKPRHAELIAGLRSMGASVSSPPAGDVAGSLEVLLPGGEADVLMGIGGTPEGLMTACAVRALGGGMQMRLAPQSTREADALRGIAAIDRPRRLEELVWGEAFFVATGVSGGALLRRPWQSHGAQFTESLVVASHAVQRIVDARAPESFALGQETDTG